MGALDGRHALITGGGTGIGAAIARLLAGEGAAVSLAGRRQAPLDNVAASLPKAAAIVADITRPDDCTRMLAAAREAHGPVDIVVANAGGVDSAPAGKISAEHWGRIIHVNLTGAFHTVQAALNGGGGLRRVIFMASTAGLKGYPYVAAYCAAKHGVIGLMRALAVELGRDGLTVNAVCPGFTDTPLLAGSIAAIAAKTGRSADEARAALARDNPQGRLITPEEVARKVLWLCLPAADAINGQAIELEGRS